MSYLFFTIGLIVGIAICVAFPNMPGALRFAINNARKAKLDNYTSGVMEQPKETTI